MAKRTVLAWKTLLIEVEKTTKKEFKDIEYIAERIQTISGNEDEELSEAECWILARKISKAV